MSEMTSKGREPWPPLYHDERRLELLADDQRWPDHVLYDRIVWYQGFLHTEQSLMPNGKARAERNLAHFKFERDCRLGRHALHLFNEAEVTERVEDEQSPDSPV